MAGRGRDTNRYYLNWGKQGKHIEGHNNYITGRSPITISKERLEQLFNQFRGTGEKVGNKEIHVNFNEIIGKWYDKDSGEWVDTSYGTIHYDSDGGWHVVPEMPKEFKEKFYEK